MHFLQNPTSRYPSFPFFLSSFCFLFSDFSPLSLIRLCFTPYSLLFSLFPLLPPSASPLLSSVSFLYPASPPHLPLISAVVLCFLSSLFCLAWPAQFLDFSRYYVCVVGLTAPLMDLGVLYLDFVYSSFYIYKQRWVLEFPIIQPQNEATPLAIKLAFMLSTIAYLISAVLVMFLPNNFKSSATMSKFITEQILLCCGSFSVFLCWELSHHLHQVLNTKRFVFAPPKGSAAVETNPSEPLLAALEESSPGSLAQHLAYLDLCMCCENNVDTWRRAAFFEETGETYKRLREL